MGIDVRTNMVYSCFINAEGTSLLWSEHQGPDTYEPLSRAGYDKVSELMIKVR